MISLFGDLFQEEGQAIDGPILSAIMAGLDVRPEAARVALHRLRNDGWIISEKSGRISSHSLSAKGRAESAAASPRIYADPTLDNGDWQLIVTEDAGDPVGADFTQLAPRVFVGAMRAKPPSGAIVLTVDAAPNWVRDQVAPQAQQQGYENLLAALDQLQADLPPPSALSAVNIAVLRCLIVHNWRRLVLKHPKLPGALVDPDGAPHRCHVAVSELLSRYPRPALADVEQSCAAA